MDEGARLFPSDPAERDDVVRLCRWLDEGLGPDGRRLMYAHMLDLKKPMLRVNNQGVPRWEAWAITALWPLMTRWGRRQLGIGPTTIRDDEQRVRETFDAIAERLGDGRAHLCGERFSAADLTFACLASAVLVPPEYGVRLPQPNELPDHIAHDIRALREHPAGAYALDLFRRERVPPA
jgi:glutathione S-transferase